MLPSRREAAQYFQWPLIAGVIEMDRYLQAFDALLREEARQPKGCIALTSANRVFQWPDQGGSPATIVLDDLLRFHEYERQRLGQELHDSAGQLLVALQLSVAHLREIESDAGHDDLLDEINDTVRRIDQEIRSLAFLDYPAELGDRGLSCAVQGLAIGFGRRTGIPTSFKCIGGEAPVSEVSEQVSAALLRVAQEGLANIHRHAHASSVTVVLERRQTHLHLTVSDDGIGMPEGAMQNTRGIGLQGMRRRVEKLGGRFRIGSLKRGTRLSAIVPLPA